MPPQKDQSKLKILQNFSLKSWNFFQESTQQKNNIESYLPNPQPYENERDNHADIFAHEKTPQIKNTKRWTRIEAWLDTNLAKNSQRNRFTPIYHIFAGIATRSNRYSFIACLRAHGQGTGIQFFDEKLFPSSN